MLHCMSFAQMLAQANVIHTFYQMLHSHNNELLSALIWKHVQSHHWRYRFQSACDTKAIQQTSKKKLESKSNYKTKILAVVNLDILQSQQYFFFHHFFARGWLQVILVPFFFICVPQVSSTPGQSSWLSELPSPAILLSAIQPTVA